MATAIPKPDHWLTTGERGTLVGIRAVFFMATVFGRLPTRLLARGIALWYALFDKKAKAASRQWLAQVEGVEPDSVSWRQVYGHVLRFTQVTIDRLFFLKGKTSQFDVRRTGPEHLQAAKKAGKGAILLGAHLGSFEAMRSTGKEDELPLNILGNFTNAKMINELFAKLNPDLAARVIHIEPGSVNFVFEIRQALERGEFVAILGDRVGLDDRRVEVTFMGRKTEFPAGPLMIAYLLKAPILLTFGLYHEPNIYDVHCEPFSDRLLLPRADRDAHLQAAAQRYADRLEFYVRKAPLNWFNFYDFWP
ncbi:MAG: putative LPLAT superfamily acyltransferase [Myxococcota bacterium]|jgi:predicted LPLAT superfamily acyltransferase